MKSADCAFAKMKDEMDADGDGKISRDEWIAKYGSATGFDEVRHRGGEREQRAEGRESREQSE